MKSKIVSNIGILLVLLSFMLPSYSFGQTRNNFDINSENNLIELCDSTSFSSTSCIISICNNIRSIAVEDTINGLNFYYGFFKDGITPAYLTKRNVVELSQKTLRFYSNGQLNQSYSFINEKLHGWYLIYNPKGIIVYKALYNEGTIDIIEIDERDNEAPQFIEENDSN